MSGRIDMAQTEDLTLTPDQQLQAQIDEQKRYIAALEERLEAAQSRVEDVEANCDVLRGGLEDYRERAASLEHRLVEKDNSVLVRRMHELERIMWDGPK
ncbi:hypothetical protein RSO41_05865 [Halomonas sp. I1]|uniref:hypothetical protein n=1 Tax=Halomonas sp. I1 TaxID=393536 RepID=UPI0028E04DC7|nr:hypothetical protein [Halomonas sp. I1]MDT8894175.1 hypothetical protein [Halomonas sp. I1]